MLEEVPSSDNLQEKIAELEREKAAVEQAVSITTSRMAECDKIATAQSAILSTRGKERKEAYMSAVLERTIDRIKNETLLSQFLGNLMPADAIVHLTKYMAEDPRILNPKESRALVANMETTHPGVLSSFYGDIEQLEGAVTIAGQVLTTEKTPLYSSLERLGALWNGGLPKDFTIIYHELIHTFHLPAANSTPTASIRTVFDERHIHHGRGLKASLLFEIHAYYAEFEIGKPGGRMVIDGEQYNFETRFDFLLFCAVQSFSQKKVKPDQITEDQKTRCRAAYHQIERLRALGYSHEEIASLVRREEWDEASGLYRNLSTQELPGKRGNEEDFPDLLKIYHLERDLTVAKIELISQKEFLAMFPDFLQRETQIYLLRKRSHEWLTRTLREETECDLKKE